MKKLTALLILLIMTSLHGPFANMAATMQDYYAIFRDDAGREFPLFSQNGYIHKVDVFRNGQFIRAGHPPGRA